jgi:predicted TIM-barrel fold metal-dependent hydrolase
MLPPLPARAATIIVDHFGLPDKEIGIENIIFRYLTSAAPTRKVWVEVSAPRRHCSCRLADTARRLR